MVIQAKEKRGRFLPELVLIFLTAILIISLPAFILWSDYNGRISDARQSMRFVTNLVTVQLKASMEEQEKMLLGIEREIRHSHMDPEILFNKRFKEYLLGVKSTYKNLMDVLILDGAGSIVQWTGEGLPPVVTDRPYSAVHMNNQDSTLFVGDPLLSKVHKDQWFFAISLPVRSDGGRLLNVIVAVIDIKHFQAQLKGIELPPESVLGVVSRSGKVITRTPDHDRVVGMQVEQASAIWNSGQTSGTVDIQSPVDQVDRVVAYQLLDKYDFGTYSGIARKTVLERFYFYRFLTICMVLVIFLVFVVLSRKIVVDHKLMARQKEQLFTQAHTDELTGLCNRRYFMRLSEAEQKRSRRYQHPVSYMMVDIDHFKAINDTHGHNLGDLALVSFADILRSSCRNEDVPCRYGGEEFLVMLPETTGEETMRLAERLRKTVQESTLTVGAISINFTVSIGVATMNPIDKASFPYVVIKHADEALYRAKHAGRNRVC
ncbi:MAG: sensor domain-containing diguanylate cyclase [Thermodesulfobacteriota bacterium]